MDSKSWHSSNNWGKILQSGFKLIPKLIISLLQCSFEFLSGFSMYKRTKNLQNLHCVLSWHSSPSQSYIALQHTFMHLDTSSRAKVFRQFSRFDSNWLSFGSCKNVFEKKLDELAQCLNNLFSCIFFSLLATKFY